MASTDIAAPRPSTSAGRTAQAGASAGAVRAAAPSVRPGRSPVGAESEGLRSVAVTGARGFLGSHVMRALAAGPGSVERALGIDVRPGAAGAPAAEGACRTTWAEADVRDPGLADLLADHAVDAVVHLAFTVSPGVPRDVARAVDIDGTRNVLRACRAAGVGWLCVASSCAAYGYSPHNAAWLAEDAPLNACEAFAYAWHKRLVEDMLREHRAHHPGLRQLVLRPGAILGPGARTPVTAPFERPVVVGLRGVASPFAFVWVDDVAAAIATGLATGAEGIFNVAGDGVMTLRDCAAHMGKPYVALPAGLLRGALAALHRVGLTAYGPEHVAFLAERPVPRNDALKHGLGCVPGWTARQAFAAWWRSLDRA